MTSLDGRLSLNDPNVKMLDTSKLKTSHVSELPEEEYNSFLNDLETFLEARYREPADTSGNAAYKSYANVEANGEVVAKIDNHGFVETSNALGSQIRKLIEQADQEASVKEGPLLAQARAEHIAAALGGTVVKSSTALTQSQFNATPQPTSTVDYEAMKNDPAYQQLQKLKQARTAFLTQQLAQEGNVSEATQEIENISSYSEAEQKFLDYMNMTPEERYFELFLSQEGLTKEELEALPPEDREEILARIEDKIEEKVKEDAGIA